MAAVFTTSRNTSSHRKACPKDLHWFKWEAYLTFISGFLLLCLMYYFNADMYLIDKAKMLLTPAQATFIGLCFLGGGVVFLR